MFPRLTHDCEVDLGLPDAQLALHHQCVAATVLLARCQDGELAAALAVLHLDVLALLDLQVEAGVKRGGSSTLYSQGHGAGSRGWPLLSIVVHICNATAGDGDRRMPGTC